MFFYPNSFCFIYTPSFVLNKQKKETANNLCLLSFVFMKFGFTGNIIGHGSKFSV